MKNLLAGVPRSIRSVLVASVVLLAVLVYFAWQHFFPATAGSGWSFTVYLDDVQMVSALAKDGEGVLHITHELNRQQGSLVKQMPDGTLKEVLAGLDKPDGLVAFQNGLLLTQEGGDYPVLWWHDGILDKLFDGKDIEGIDVDAQAIYAIEDIKSAGRLLRHDLSTGQTLVLRKGLQEAEGVAVCPDGRLFYSEKKQGWVKQYRPGETVDPVILTELKAPGFLMCNPEGLWIAEDATHGARLLLLDPSGNLRTILGHLRSAQMLLSLAPGHLLLAEQGRNRILDIRLNGNGSY